MPIFDLTPCEECGHVAAIHQVGSVCGAMHCYCKAFIAVQVQVPDVDEVLTVETEGAPV